MVLICERYLVWVVDQSIVEGFEEFGGFDVVVVSSSCRFRLGRPVYGDVFSVAFLKCLPKWAVGSSVPGVIKGLHQFKIFFSSQMLNLTMVYPLKANKFKADFYSTQANRREGKTLTQTRI